MTELDRYRYGKCPAMLKRLKITKKGKKQIWEHKAFSHKETKKFDIAFWKKAGAQAAIRSRLPIDQ